MYNESGPLLNSYLEKFRNLDLSLFSDLELSQHILYHSHPPCYCRYSPVLPKPPFSAPFFLASLSPPSLLFTLDLQYSILKITFK